MNTNKPRFEPAVETVAVFVLSLLFVSGCADKQPIQFSDEHMATLRSRAETPAPRPVKTEKPTLTKPDLFKVELAVYRNLLQRHFWDNGDYSAVFLQGDDDEVDALIKEFPDHIPPIKRSSSADLRPNHAPLDKDTGKTAMILSVDTLDPVGDTVQAIGKWYAGDAVSGAYTFNLHKTGDDWVVESTK